ncbi:RICIN domain-containing protein [Olsenella sp. YH-ols2223]|uniref:RICIN domain-containing protein n=1 Tax=Olsenella absiana TaxID=3115222 RepID=A0ABU7R778_9ACTN
MQQSDHRGSGAGRAQRQRPHERTGALPRIEGTNYIDSTGGIGSTGELRRLGREDEARRRVRPRDERGLTMGLPRIDADDMHEFAAQGERTPQGHLRGAHVRAEERIGEGRAPQAPRREGAAHATGMRSAIPASVRQGTARPGTTRQGVTRQGAARQGMRAEVPQRRHNAPMTGRIDRRKSPLLPLVAGVLVVAVAIVGVALAVGSAKARRAGEQGQPAPASESQTQQGQAAAEAPTQIAGLAAGTYYLEVTDNDGAVLAANGHQDSDYTTVLVARLGTDAFTEQLTLAVNDDETCTLSFANGLVLDCGDATAPAGQALYASAASGSDTQRWQLRQNSDGSYLVVNKATGNAIEASDVSAGSSVATDAIDSSDLYQRITFVPASSASGA